MLMPNRSYTAGSQFRYGFNGKEQDKEAYSKISYDYGFRIYSPVIGRFLSVDPLSKSYPWYTPYQFAGNKPIFAIDVDGLEDAPYSIGRAVSRNEAWAAEVRRTDPEHAEQRIFEMNKNAFLFVGGGLTLGYGFSAFSFVGTSNAITNLSARAILASSSYSVAVANLGAFTIELLNPDPNGTPGLEFTQGDEVARGLKLLFKQAVGPLVKPVERFIVNTSKFDYLFGKLEYQNLKGAELEKYASNVGYTVESLIKNQDRASSMAKVFEYWGIKDNQAGLVQLGELFSAGLNGKVINTKTNEFGTSVTREIFLIFTAGEKKGQSAGSIQISYFYKDGNMSAIPEISSVIPIPDKSVN
ncbi:RHS repeat-associated core domain-containing protein [Paraflavitalea sp. sgz302555]